MPHINTKPTALWIEDEGHQVSAWKSHLASAFSFATEDPVEDEVSARETLKKMSDRVDLLITDLKIRSGPNQTFPPDLGTAHAWGLELVQRSAEMWPNLPVIAYSRYIGSHGTATAVTNVMARHPHNLLNIYQTKSRLGPVVKEMLLKYMDYKKFVSSTSRNLADYTQQHPAGII